jgi:hypothetical protein
MEVAGANRRWRGQFRYRGSRRESAVAQLFSLGIITRHEKIRDYWIVGGDYHRVCIVASVSRQDFRSQR